MFVPKTSSRHIFNTSSRRFSVRIFRLPWGLQDVFARHCQDVLEDEKLLCCVEEVFKTCLENVFKNSWRPSMYAKLQDKYDLSVLCLFYFMKTLDHVHIISDSFSRRSGKLSDIVCVNRNRHMPKSCWSSLFLFTLYHLLKETLSTCCKKRWRVREKQKLISPGQMMNYSFSLKPRWTLKASATFKDKVANRKDLNMKIFWILR